MRLWQRSHFLLGRKLVSSQVKACLSTEARASAVSRNSDVPAQKDTAFGVRWWRAHGRRKRHLAREQQEKTTPLGRIARPDNIALAPTFLASDDARWMTGQVIVVAGSERM